MRGFSLRTFGRRTTASAQAFGQSPGRQMGSCAGPLSLRNLAPMSPVRRWIREESVPPFELF